MMLGLAGGRYPRLVVIRGWVRQASASASLMGVEISNVNVSMVGATLWRRPGFTFEFFFVDFRSGERRHDRRMRAGAAIRGTCGRLHPEEPLVGVEGHLVEHGEEVAAPPPNFYKSAVL